MLPGCSSSSPTSRRSPRCTCSNLFSATPPRISPARAPTTPASSREQRWSCSSSSRTSPPPSSCSRSSSGRATCLRSAMSRRVSSSAPSSLIGLVSVLGVVSLQQQDATGAGAGAVAVALAAIKDWTFLLGPGFVVGIGNGMLLGYLMYRSGLVPRRMAMLGLVGGPLICLSGILVLLGAFDEGGTAQAIATIPEFLWELSLGIWLAVKGFNSSPILPADGGRCDPGGRTPPCSPSGTDPVRGRSQRPRPRAGRSRHRTSRRRESRSRARGRRGRSPPEWRSASRPSP